MKEIKAYLSLTVDEMRPLGKAIVFIRNTVYKNDHLCIGVHKQDIEDFLLEYSLDDKTSIKQP